MRTLLIILLLAATAGAQDLSWLTGHWTTENSEEVWSESRDGNLMGYNRQFKDGAVVFFEHLRVEQVGDDILYQACPVGKSWTSFKLIKSDKKEAVFSNPKHDFPQQIQYRREEDTLFVTISGQGQESVSWRFELKP
jgi:Domain of unknown function (DUF6265)